MLRLTHRRLAGVLAAIVARGAPGAPPFEPWVPSIEQQLQSGITDEVVAALQRRFESSMEGRARLDELVNAHATDFGAFVERARPVKEEWDLSLRLPGPGGRKPDKYEARAARATHLAPLADEQFALDERLLSQVRELMAARGLCCWDELLLEVHRVRTSGEGSLQANDEACAVALESVRQATDTYLAAVANVLSPEQRAAFEAARKGPTSRPTGRVPTDGREE